MRVSVDERRAYVVEEIPDGEERTSELLDRRIGLEETDEFGDRFELALEIAERFVELRQQHACAHSEFVVGHGGDFVDELFG